MSKALVLLSGGMDSTTCLHWARNNFGDVRALVIDYGQKHHAEINCAFCMAFVLGIPRKLITTNILSEIKDSALLNPAIDVNSPHKGNAKLPASFVPGRNILFITIAAMQAYAADIDNIVIGANQTDFSGYPDCRADFMAGIEYTLRSGMGSTVNVLTPLMNKTKVEIIKMGADLGIFETIKTHTHTCYNGDRNEWHPVWGYGCGECAACKIRIKAYEDYDRIYGQGNK